MEAKRSAGFEMKKDSPSMSKHVGKLKLDLLGLMHADLFQTNTVEKEMNDITCLQRKVHLVSKMKTIIYRRRHLRHRKQARGSEIIEAGSR
jgi:hypothetical protein